MPEEFEDIYSTSPNPEQPEQPPQTEPSASSEQIKQFENDKTPYFQAQGTEEYQPEQNQYAQTNFTPPVMPENPMNNMYEYNTPYQQPTIYPPFRQNNNSYQPLPMNYNYNFPPNPMNQQLPPIQPQGESNKSQKKSGILKVSLICVSSILGIVSIALILLIVQSSFGSKNNSILPEQSSGYNVEPSYGTASQLPDAPDVSASESGPQISTQETSESRTAESANAAYKKASPSVVCITSYEAGTEYALTESGEGSGIIITPDGYIATNSHVVGDSKNTGVMITLNTGEQYLGTIIGIDKKTDLAVIKIDANNLTPANFADSGNLVVGQEVYAIGNPGGSAFSNSLTCGSISAINRVLSSNAYVKYIQTDAAINPGNSGGALINEYGQVIGINTAKLVGTDYEGMGFAIPSNKVVEIINKLIRYGYINDRGTLGIDGKTCSLYTSKANNIPQGMIITKINSESSLYATKVMENDIITAVNGIEIKSATELIEQITGMKPGDKVTLTIFRPKSSVSGKPHSYDFEATLINDTEN